MDGKNPKSVWWNDKIKLGCLEDVEKKDVWKLTERRRERLKGV